MIVKKGNKTILKPDKDILDFLEYASKEVEKMPYWKQGMLMASSLSANQYERPTLVKLEDEE